MIFCSLPDVTHFMLNQRTRNFLIKANNPCLIPAFAAAIAADGFHAHGGRRGRAGRRGGRFIGRRGREESGLAAGGYIAPGDEAAAAGYASPSEDVPVYAGEEALGGYDASDAAGDPALDMLLQSIPGVPGEDYPIYAEVPETAFACDGQVDGGKKTSFHWNMIVRIVSWVKIGCV